LTSRGSRIRMRLASLLRRAIRIPKVSSEWITSAICAHFSPTAVWVR
jgi:hypothetical protein